MQHLMIFQGDIQISSTNFCL